MINCRPCKICKTGFYQIGDIMTNSTGKPNLSPKVCTFNNWCTRCQTCLSNRRLETNRLTQYIMITEQ